MESTAATTARTATQSLVSALGGGSGMNMGQLASDLAAASFAPRIDRLATKSETLDRQITAASNLKSMILSLATSLGQRIREGDLSPQPRLANASVAQASLSGGVQPKGSYSLEVTTLAASQTLASPAYAAATDPVGSGALTLRFGTIAGAAFSEDPGHAAVAIPIASGATLGDVAAAINGAGAGVSAYVANTVDGAKLVLKGAEGAANGFVLEAAETVGEEGLANLAWNPAAPGAGRLLKSAGDAAFKIDGLAIAAPSNSAANAIPGVTLKLTGTNPGAPTTMTFSDPSAAITGAMQDLTAALNEIAGELKTQTALSGDLNRDSGARALQRTFSALAGTVIMPGAPADAPQTLADLGLSTQRDGSFTLDTARLAATLARDPEGTAAMFTTGLHGVYASIDSISRRASAISDPGSLGGSIKRYSDQKRQAGEDQTALAEKQEALRARLAKQFTVSENRVGASRSTLAFLKNQIDAWNAQNN